LDYLGPDQKDLCEVDNIRASQDHNTPGSCLIPMIATMLVSVPRKKSAGTREGRYRPTRTKTFIDRLQTAKQEKEELKIKLMDFSTTEQGAYIAVNLRKFSNH